MTTAGDVKTHTQLTVSGNIGNIKVVDTFCNGYHDNDMSREGKVLLHVAIKTANSTFSFVR